MAMTACNHHHQQEGHAPNEVLQLTAYSDRFEVYAAAEPFVAGTESEIVAHFTFLDSFKPLEAGTVIASLVSGGEVLAQDTLTAPTRQGIYKLHLTPSREGQGVVLFRVQTDGTEEVLTSPAITIYTDAHAAQHAAAELKAMSSNGVVFPKEASWKAAFATDSCRLQPMGSVIRTMAQVLPAQGDERTVTAQAAGIVTIAANMSAGASVTSGQTLLTIESGTMADGNLALRYQEAENDYRIAKSEYERKQALAAEKIVSEADLRSAEARMQQAELRYNNLRRNFSSGKQVVTAPMSGFLRSLMVSNGAYVSAGQPLFTLSANRRLQIRGEVAMRYYPLLGSVTGANIRLRPDEPAVPISSLHGRLLSYGHAVSTEAPLVPVLFEIDNNGGLLPGAFVELFILADDRRPVLSVPSGALVEEMGNYFVYVQLTPEFFEKREVSIGRTDGVRTEVTSGLTGTERVVSRGAVLLKVAQAAGGLDAESGHHH